ncbi:putative E3 ubiquitin-protein ligase MID2 [Glandiceps talaboti]
MASHIENALQRELSCPICFELYSVPLLLTCGHSFCKRCLEDFQSNQEASKAVKAADTAVKAGQTTTEAGPFDASKLNCPTCRHEVKLERGGLDSLVRNYLLDSIIDQYKVACVRDGKKIKHREEVVWCGACEGEPKKAEKSCTVCKLSYCSKCLPVFHPNRGGFATHRMVPATSSSTPGVITCPKHEGEIMKMYCISCRTPICYLCDRFGGHQNHQVSEIKTVFHQEKDFLDKESKTLSEKNDTLADFVTNLEDIIKKIEESGKEMGRKVTNDFAELHALVDEAEKRIHFEIALNTTTKVGLLKEQITKCLEILNANTGTVEIVQQALRVDDHESFLLSTATLRDRLSNGSTTYGNFSRVPVNDETSDPMNSNTSTIKSYLTQFSLGYIGALPFNWKSGTIHQNLKSDPEWKSIKLESTDVPDVTNAGASGQFNGPSFSALGSVSLNSYCHRYLWRFSVSKQKKSNDQDVNFTFGIVTSSCYRHQKLETQGTYPCFLMTHEKHGKVNRYKFINQGNVVETIDEEDFLDSVIVAFDWNKRRVSFLSDSNNCKLLYVFNNCNFAYNNWQPAVALYNTKYKLELK